MRSPVQFEKFKPQLEAYFDNNVQFVFTDTHQSRKEFICERIHSREPVLDFGCGEMQYYKTLMKKGFTSNYYGYDEVDFEAVAKSISEIFKGENLFYLSTLSQVEGFEGQIILSEVIEHNTLEEAKALMIWIRDQTKFTTLYITTPDKDFNSNYEMVDEFRHDDHDFELSNPEFVELINTIFPHQKEFFGIGDCVNGIFPTSGVIIKN